MRRIVPFLAAVLMGGFTVSQAQVPEITAPGVFVPPSKSTAVPNGYQLGESVVKGYRAKSGAHHLLTNYAGMNDTFPRVDQATGVSLEGKLMPVNKTGKDLFTGSVQDDPFFVFTAEITSVDAYSTRLKLDLAHLRNGEEVWVANPDTGFTHGPYYSHDARPGGFLLPRIQGDTSLLIVRSVVDETPEIGLKEVAHMYVPFQTLIPGQSLPCQININCETDPGIQELKQAVGLMSFEIIDSFFIGFCTGTLINNPLSDSEEGLFLTADHCVNTQAAAQSTEIIWDFESSACSETSFPDGLVLPRSGVDCLLTANGSVDGSLLQLGAIGGVYAPPVPPGNQGRFYAGWTTRAPQIGEDIFGIHHPAGDDKKFSEGTIIETSATRRIGTVPYEDQIGVTWSRGLAEPGSSGSGLFLGDGSNVLVGMLSNGPTNQTCDNIGDPYYGSFAAFFPDIEPYIYRPGRPGCNQAVEATQGLKNLRAMPLRDSGRVVLTWQRPTTEPEQLVLVRRTDRFPRSHTDGTQIPLGTGAILHTDESLPVGQEVFYGIFASYGGGVFGARDFARVVAGDATGATTYEPMSEEFNSLMNPFDLSFSQLTFVPLVDFRQLAISEAPDSFMNLSNYRVHHQPGVTRFPVQKDLGSIPISFTELSNVSHTGGNIISGPAPLANQALLKLPNIVPFFGRLNRDLVVSSQGFVTFNMPADTVSLTQGDFSPLLNPTLATHYQIPRISFLFANLSPQSGGSVWARILDDRVVVTFEDVPIRFSFPPLRNSVQMELFYNGQIRMTFLQVNAPSAIVGLSDGKGVPIDPEQADFVFPGRLTSDLSAFSEPLPLQLSPIPVLTALEGETVSFTPTVTVPPGSPAPVFSSVDEPFGLSVNPSTGAINWTTGFADSGVHQFDLVVSSGTLVTSQRVVIIVENVNLKPVTTTVEVTPAIPTENDPLQVQWDYSHPEGIPQGPTLAQWFRNGQLVVALNNQTFVPDAVTRPGERWYVEVIPRTVTGLAGDSVRSNAVFIAEAGGLETGNGDKYDADVNQDGRVDAIDVQMVINGALSGAKADSRKDINRDGKVNAIDVQLVINAALR